MRKTPRDWLLDRDSDASARLDAIRRAVLAPERTTVLETVLEIFRPSLPAWSALALAWLALAAAHLALAPEARRGPIPAFRPAGLAGLTQSRDEALSLLDPHS